MTARRGEGSIEGARWFARRMREEWRDDSVPDLAAVVAFYAILSLLPALVALVSTLGVLESIVGGDLATRAESTVLDFLGSVLTDEAGGTLAAAQDLFSGSRPGLLTFSLIAAFWTLSRGFAALVRALDAVYDVDEHRSWISIRVTAFGLTVGSVVTAAVILALVIIGPLFGSGRQIAEKVGLGDEFVFWWDVARFPLLVVVLLVWAATIFHIAPDHHTPWRWDVPGAIVTGALWAIFSVGLHYYVQIARTGNAIFGALGGVFIVMLWFWLLSLAVLIGGETNEILYNEFGRDGDPEPADRSDGIDGLTERPDEIAGIDG